MPLTGTTVVTCLPLCRRYQVLCAETVELMIELDGTKIQHDARWIIESTAETRPEVLGVWINRDSVAHAWSRELQDLRRRGVERVQLVSTGDLQNLREELRTAFPGATALPSLAKILTRSLSQVATRHRAGVRRCLTEILEGESGLQAREALGAAEATHWAAKYPEVVAGWRLALEQGWALWTLPPTLRRVVLSGDGVAAALNRSLRKAVVRRGCFANVDEAQAFVVAALKRAERRLDASHAGPVAEHNHHREGFRPRIDVVGI